MANFFSERNGHGSAYKRDMEKLAVFYFTGTGNTLYMAKLLCKKLEKKYEAKFFDVCAVRDARKEISGASLVLLAFPIYGSAPPIPMREFVVAQRDAWKGKKVVICETQYFFSGDGAASLGRAVEKLGGAVIAAEHFNMPNNLADCPIFPVKNGSELNKTLARAERRAERFAKHILNGTCSRRGFGVFSRAVGYACQRKFFRKNEAEKRKKLKIDHKKCLGCGLCAKNCPVQNLTKQDSKIVPAGKCVLCYRCVNLCPARAITLVGKNPPKTQYKGIKE